MDMKRFSTSVLAILLLTAAAQAQFLPRPGGPTAGATGSPLSGGIGMAPPTAGFSPYLNLTRGGSAAVNYYGIVRPQLSFQSQMQAVQAQQQQAGGASFEPDNPLTPGLVVGTRVRFLNTAPYFLNLQGGATTGGTTAIRGAGASQGMSGSGIGTGLGSTAGGFGSAGGGSHSGTGMRGPR
jgi:hypothetical protein